MKGGLLKGDRSGGLKAAAEKVEQLTGSCIICESVQENTERYARTLLHLYKTDKAFQKAFEASKGVCMRDLALLMKLADETLSGDVLRGFLESLYTIQTREMDKLQADLDGFCVKFDYRNKDKPWGDSRGSLERAVNRLSGKTFKEEP